MLPRVFGAADRGSSGGLDAEDAAAAARPSAYPEHVGRYELVRRLANATWVGLEPGAGLHGDHGKTDTAGSPVGTVHRDESPSNILVSYEGTSRLADSGIAKAEAHRDETRPGMLKGKLAYVSPEQ